MHPRIFEEFERICRENHAGGRVLEIGAVPNDTSLLNIPALKNAESKVGINLDGPYTYVDFEIVKGNANHMEGFKDDYFDTVLCNATLEHDKFFWKTISEIRRVAKPGGLVVIATPGYTRLITQYPAGSETSKSGGVVKFLLSIREKIPFLYRFVFLYSSTLTMRIHDYPGDFYRFSPQTYREVFFEGMEEVRVYTMLFPPRVIGYGFVPRVV